LRLQGKVAIVAGAGSGIGQGIAERLDCEGAQVIVDYVDSAGGVRQTVRDLEQSGGAGEVVQADITRVGDVRAPDVCAPVDEAWTRFGSADILVSNAGKPGRIVNISSVHEDTAFPGFATYCASKGGLRMPMRDLTVELGPLGITANNLAPGTIAAPINQALLAGKPRLDAPLDKIPLGRLGKPEDLASVVTFLAAGAAACVTGPTFVVDGGLMRNYREQRGDHGRTH
jgi:glucose 1-dehydrogenase